MRVYVADSEMYNVRVLRFGTVVCQRSWGGACATAERGLCGSYYGPAR